MTFYARIKKFDYLPSGWNDKMSIFMETVLKFEENGRNPENSSSNYEYAMVPLCISAKGSRGLSGYSDTELTYPWVFKRGTFVLSSEYSFNEFWYLKVKVTPMFIPEIYDAVKKLKQKDYRDLLRKS
jgi:hypothetical protein